MVTIQGFVFDSLAITCAMPAQPVPVVTVPDVSGQPRDLSYPFQIADPTRQAHLA